MYQRPASRRSCILGGVCPRRPSAAAAVLLAALALALAACGSGDGAAARDDGATGRDDGARTSTSAAAQTSSRAAARSLAAAPAALRANAADANTLTGEGEDALHARLDKLHGHPVVVNVWASWCGPCRAEFPFFADAVVEHGDEVAFVGIDFDDDRESAGRFLREVPPGFASVFDPAGDAARSLGGGRAMPTTFFLDRDGEVAHTKLGGYPDAAALEDDIRRYALPGA